MLNSKRLFEMAKKWQKAAIFGRKRILLSSGNDSMVASKGCFVVYSLDWKRFTIPVSCLSNNVLRELLKISEEEFGFPSSGPITLPCDAACVEYVISLLGRNISGDVEKALLASIATCRCFESSLDFMGRRQQPQAIHVF